MDILTDIKNTKLVDYKTAMRLKKLGFNEPCEYLYTTAIRHNGEDLGSDEQYELEAEGHADEIEYVPGGWLECHYNKNDLDYLNDDACSAPFVNVVIDWLEDKHRVLVAVSPSFQNGFQLSEKYGNKYGVVFSNRWVVDIYSVGNPITDVYRDGKKIDGFFADTLIDWSGDEYEGFNSRVEAEKYGIKYALDNYVKE